MPGQFHRNEFASLFTIAFCLLYISVKIAPKNRKEKKTEGQKVAVGRRGWL